MAGQRVDPESRGVEVGPPGGELGKDQFMQLLVAQMQNQDPIDPVDNKDMIAQLAQFSALEQMQNLNEKFDGFQRDTLMALSSTLIGRQVEVNDPVGLIGGEVVSLALEDGVIKVELDSGLSYELGLVTRVLAPEPEESHPSDVFFEIDNGDSSMA